MASPSRSSQFNKVHKVLKRRYRMVAPDPNRTVFEQLVFACCLENAHYDRAEEAFAALVHGFFDWNEIRVSTVRELSDVMACLPKPPDAANRVKRVLQSIFESTYSFDLEELNKQNLGPAVAYLKELDGTTNFAVAYVTQTALGGHAIPVDAGALQALSVVELASQEEVEEGAVRGLERAIAKSKGLEFSSLLHQLGADFIADPYASALHEILLEINPHAGERLPKRRARKRPRSAAQSAKRKAARKEAREKGRKEARGEPSQEIVQPKRKQAGGKKKSAADKPFQPEKKPAASKKKTTAKKKADAGTGQSGAARLSKRKPR